MATIIRRVAVRPAAPNAKPTAKLRKPLATTALPGAARASYSPFPAPPADRRLGCRSSPPGTSQCTARAASSSAVGLRATAVAVATDTMPQGGGGRNERHGHLGPAELAMYGAPRQRPRAVGLHGWADAPSRIRILLGDRVQVAEEPIRSDARSGELPLPVADTLAPRAGWAGVAAVGTARCASFGESRMRGSSVEMTNPTTRQRTRAVLRGNSDTVEPDAARSGSLTRRVESIAKPAGPNGLAGFSLRALRHGREGSAACHRTSRARSRRSLLRPS